MLSTWRFFKALLPYVRLAPRVVAATALFGLLSSLAESVGLSLFIPLLRGLERGPTRGPSDRFVSTMSSVFADVAPDYRVPAIALAVLAAVFLRSALSYVTQLLYAATEERVGSKLRCQAYSQLLDVEYSYWERRASDRLFATLAEDTWRTTSALRTAVFLVVTVCALAAYLTVLFLIDWLMTLLVSCALLVFQVPTRLLTRRALAHGRVFTRANTRLTKRMIETFQGMKVIRAFGREGHEKERFDRASRRVSRTLFQTARVQAFSGPFLELAAATTVVVLLVTASARHEDLSALLVFLLVLYRLQAPARDFANAVVSLGTLQASVAQVSSLLQADDKPYMRGGEAPFSCLRHGIRLEDVFYTYAGSEHPALSAISIFIPKGRITAIVGPSGSGKTTLVKLLQRLYDPDRGTIWVDHQRLSALELASVRKRVASVSQDVYLFDRSVRANIAYGRPDASLEQIVAAAKKADAHTFISDLPDGYDTRVGDRGAAISGGQAQRVALARAILAEPELLILDEATNSLDAISEAVVRDALNALHGKCTVVVVAHRFSTIERAENIVVLENGQLREQGTFDSLLRKENLFARLHGGDGREMARLGSVQ